MIKLIILLPVIFLSVLPLPALAVTDELIPKGQLQSMGFTDYESINPNSLLYQFKRLFEKARLFLIFDEDHKNKYTTSLVEVRFNELIYIINFEKTSFLMETVNRYNVFVGKIPSDPGKAKENLGILEKLRDMYPANSAYWLSIQQAIDITRNLL